MSQSRAKLKAHRINRKVDLSHDSSWKKPAKHFQKSIAKNSTIDCGWGKLLFGHTFDKLEEIRDILLDEKKDCRNIAFYLPDPHVILSLAPQELFLDPSHTFRIRFERYTPSKRALKNLYIRRVEKPEDIEAINRIYKSRQMVPLSKKMKKTSLVSRDLTYLVAEDVKSKDIVGCVLGVDHVHCFNDPEGGSSLWALAVDPSARTSGIGEALVRYLIEHFKARGRSYMDLSVMHNNHSAIALYEKLGFERVPVFCVKKKNAINEPLYVRAGAESRLNPYAKLIVAEAKRRGILVKVDDPSSNLFTLSFGGRSLQCWESLTELTDALAYLRCSRKDLTYQCLKKAKIRVPQFEAYTTKKEAEAFLRKHKRVVVKPVDSEQGRGISVDVRTKKELLSAVERASRESTNIQLEEFVEGHDLRVVVIDYKVVAASLRLPPIVLGNGKDTVKALIQKLSRRRKAATGGESQIPLDEETERVLRQAGYRLGDVLPSGVELQVRKTANLHTGGMLCDVTAELHPKLIEVSEKIAHELKVPVTGLDLIVPDHRKPKYCLIEANERPGLANHEPQPTAERFIDLLFPQTKTLDPVEENSDDILQAKH